ncbi:MAG: photosystem II protein Psb27 [Cyanobacteria bacterium]|jgi:photosystem II Psb27 protein|nr:photosystem II protein Psb27 [Cyanobacteriota bacterium]
MKRILSRLMAIVLVILIGVTGASSAAMADSLSGDYPVDALALVELLRQTVDVAPDATDRIALQNESKKKINEFASRYRRGSVMKLNSYTTMRTAINSLAGHYTNYPNRPVPEKMKKRLLTEFRQVETALKRGA